MSAVIVMAPPTLLAVQTYFPASLGTTWVITKVPSLRTVALRSGSLAYSRLHETTSVPSPFALQLTVSMSPAVTTRFFGGFAVNRGIVRTTSCIISRVLPMKFVASHMYIPESPAVVLTMLKFAFLEKLRCSGRLGNTRDHVIVGEGNPVAMHDGKAKSFPSKTYVGRWDNGLIRGVAIEEVTN